MKKLKSSPCDEEEKTECNFVPSSPLRLLSSLGHLCVTQVRIGRIARTVLVQIDVNLHRIAPVLNEREADRFPAASICCAAGKLVDFTTSSIPHPYLEVVLAISVGVIEPVGQVQVFDLWREGQRLHQRGVRGRS